MELQEQNLLSLLRTALWGVPACCDTPDWRAIAGLAHRQTVTGLLYDAVLALPAALQPDSNFLRTLHIQSVRIAQSHRLFNARIAEITMRLQAEGIRTVLLKGQGVAQNYPNPQRRCCGDIDLYVGEPDYTRTCRLLSVWGMIGDDATESVQHLHFDYKGVHIELHRIAGMMYNARRNRLFRQWSDTMLKGDTCRTVRTGDAGIMLPPVQFDVLYIFYHTYRHFLTGGIGLRQLCDWTMYLHTFGRDADQGVLHHDLCRFHLLHQWQVMGYIAVHHLGLPQEEFPFYNPAPGVRNTADAMMRLIMLNGNFGFHNPTRTNRPDGYLAGKLHSFIGTHRRLWQVLPLSPADTADYYLNYLCTGVLQLYKDKFTTKAITGTTTK